MYACIITFEEHLSKLKHNHWKSDIFSFYGIPIRFRGSHIKVWGRYISFEAASDAFEATSRHF